MALLKLANAEIEIFEFGKGPPVLFLHAEDYFEQHRPFLDALGGKRSVVAPRHPGFGNSPLPSDYRTVEDLANLYLDLIDSKKLEKPLLIGASFGGWIALELAVRAPEKFSGLVLLGTVGVKMGGREDRDFADIYQIPEEEIRSLTFADPAKWVPDYPNLGDDQLTIIARDRQSTLHYGWKPYLHNPSLRKWLHRVRMPTLLVWGEKDGVVSPKYAKALAAALPNAKVQVVANAGHYPQIEQKDAVVAAIDAFSKS